MDINREKGPRKTSAGEKTAGTRWDKICRKVIRELLFPEISNTTEYKALRASHAK